MTFLLSAPPVSTKRQIFGPEGELGVEVVLPVTFYARLIPRESGTFRLSLLSPNFAVADMSLT